MNKRAFLRNSALATLALALPGCSKRLAESNPSGVDYYTCTMHPSVRSKDPGKCPVCGMDLVPVLAGTAQTADAKETGPREFVVPVERQQQIGVTYTAVSRKALRRTLRAAAIIQSDAAHPGVVWALADFYEDDFSLLKKGQKATVTSRALSGVRLEGTVTQIAPSIDTTTRTVKVRIDIRGPVPTAPAGAYATAMLDVEMGEGLAIPISAIIPTGTHNIAFVDKGEGRLQPRYVTLGPEFDDCYEVLSGVSEGERVVSSANFLIDAESKVQGALKDFSGESPEGGQ